MDRIDLVLSSPDNQHIPKVENAGDVIDGYLVMHNGLRIHPMSYYGYPIKRMLKLNKGVHEPQEERVFMEVLKTMRPGATMLELGSFWSFYSMWFQKEVYDAKCYMVEPMKRNLEAGKSNFELNAMVGTFMQGFISDTTNPQEMCLHVDGIVETNNIEFVDILHSDIQGFELKMLHGAKYLLAERRVGYIFVSTHGNKVHNDCVNFLQQYDFRVIALADLDQTYSEDGLIVMRAPWYSGIDTVNISLRTH